MFEYYYPTYEAFMLDCKAAGEFSSSLIMRGTFWISNTGEVFSSEHYPKP